jgi:hypothetical protein
MMSFREFLWLNSWGIVTPGNSAIPSQLLIPYIPITKTPSNKKMDWFGTSVFFWMVTIGFLIVVIQKQ